MMQRLLSVVSVMVIMVMLLAGCSAPVGGGKANSSSQVTETASVSTPESSSAVSSDESSSTAKELTRGKVEGNTYINSYADFIFKAPENWVYASDKEIAEMMGVGLESFAGPASDFAKALVQNKAVYDMLALDSNTGSSVTVMYQKLTLTAGGALFSEDEFLQASKIAFAASQSSYTFGDFKDETVSGDSYRVLTAELSEQGLKQYIYARKMDKYMLSFIVTVCGDDDITKIMGNFA